MTNHEAEAAFAGQAPEASGERMYTRRWLLTVAMPTLVVAGAAVGGVGGFLLHDPLVNLAASTRSEYTGLEWDDTTQSTPVTNWQAFDADPSTKNNPPGAWEKVALIAINAAAFDDQLRELGGHQAVAVRMGDDRALKLGIRALGRPFLTRRHGDDGNYTFGLRVGPEDLIWTPGIVIPNSGQFVQPEVETLHVGVTTVDDIARDYPGVHYG